MIQSTRTFRIFVSSTFSDLKEERNALQEKVFPKLRELCTQHGCRFQAIDLRWGVSEEAALDQQAMRICLEEVDRCQRLSPRPNFIILLGDRYGWQPLPYEIPASEYEAILSQTSPNEAALLNRWYRRDDNAVRPVYDLQPREGEYEDFNVWEPVEKELLGILRRVVARMDMSADARFKYVASATEQEIIRGTMGTSNAHEHVFCFFRNFLELPEGNAVKDFVGLDANGKLDRNAHEKLLRLKNDLRDRLKDNVHEYETQWTGNGITKGHIDLLCDDVLKKLSGIIETEVASLEKIDPLDKEIDDHKTFAMDRTRHFTGRADMIRAVADYAEKGGSTSTLCIYGESGSGKSALMARAAEGIGTHFPHVNIIQRFIGVTPASSDIRSLLESLCRQISRLYSADESAIPEDYKELRDKLPEILAFATEEKPLIIFLDALDQLSENENAQNLVWLPSELPAHVRVIVSTLNPSESLSALTRRLTSESMLQLNVMTENDGEVLLDLWLQDSERTLENHQRNEIIGKFRGSGLPLYLKLSFEMARHWKSYSSEINLSYDIPGLIKDLFIRLSEETEHGEIMVSRSIGYLATARHGLTEDELLDILSADHDVMDDFKRRSPNSPPINALPVVVWSRLYLDLKPYLTARSADNTSLITFFHQQFKKVITESALFKINALELHMKIAHYFNTQPNCIENTDAYNFRKLSELPYQQIQGNMWCEIESTLTDLTFIEAKCAGQMIFDLLNDYNSAISAVKQALRIKDNYIEMDNYINNMIAYSKGDINTLEIIPSIKPWNLRRIQKESKRIITNPNRIDRINAFSQFVHLETTTLSVLGSIPGYCFQQAYNYTHSGPVSRSATQLIDSGTHDNKPLILNAQKNDYNPLPAIIRTTKIEGMEVDCLSITPDGRTAIVGSYDKLFVLAPFTGKILRTIESINPITGVDVTPNGDIAIVAAGKYVLVFNLSSGGIINKFIGHEIDVNSVCISPDGTTAITASGHRFKQSHDNTVRIWSITTGKCLQILSGHKSVVSCVKMTADGRFAISGSGDRTLRIWNMLSGQCINVLSGHKDYIESLYLTPDGKTAVSGSWDNTIRVWDIETGKCSKILYGHSGWVRSISATPDGKTAISGSNDLTIRVWDLTMGKCIRIYDESGCYPVCLTADGKTAISGSTNFGLHDNKVYLWNIENGICRKINKKRHKGRIAGINWFKDQYFISDGEDDTIRQWNIHSHNEVKVIHRKGTRGMCRRITPDGKRAISIGDFSLDLSGDSAFIDIVKKNIYWLNSTSFYLVHINQYVKGAHNLHIYDVTNDKCIETLDGHRDTVKSICLSPDGKTVISGSEDSTIRIWDIDSGQLLKSIKGPNSDTFYILRITPDGKTLITCNNKIIDHSQDHHALCVWNLETGECLKTLATFHDNEWFRNLILSPDGRIAVSYQKSVGNFVTWDLSKGVLSKILGTIEPWDRGRIKIEDSTMHLISENACSTYSDMTNYPIQTTSDGEYLLAGNKDGTIRLWNLNTGICRAICHAGNSITALSHIRNNGLFLYGTNAGDVALAKISNFRMSTPISTPVRLWLYNTKKNSGEWDDNITSSCPCCDNRFPLPSKMIHTIESIIRNANLRSQGSSPCLDLPLEAWTEPHLKSDCPYCHAPLRFNPFIVDNR